MAEITCCTGQTECNHIITIGYLKTFIGANIKDSNGNTVYVNTSKSDSYVPTYSELTGGTLIPQFVDGGTNKWHSNVDGITVRGSYAANQGVEQTDLVLTYTRFKSLSISAGKTTFNECGDNTSVCATYKFTKTVKAMNNCVVVESSTEGSDTTCKPSFSASCNWMSLSTCSNNCITASTEKNGSWSAPSRSCNIITTVRYKGQTYSSNTISITQEALTGSYSVYEGRHYTATTITSHDELTQNTCSGVTVNASATAYYYDRYKWEDSCGLVYEYNYDDRYSSEGAGSGSHTFDPVYCPTTTQTDSYLMTITYKGYSDSVTFYQVCSQECEECLDFSTYGECNVTENVDACGGEVTLSCSMPTTIHHKGWDGQGHCVETASTQTAYTQSAVVVIPENKIQGGPGATSSHIGSITTEEGGTINYTVIQDISNPCGGCGEEYSSFTFNDVSVSCSAHTNETITVPYTLTKSYSVTACSDVIEHGDSSYTINITSCNETTSVKDYTFGGSLGNFVVHQAAGNYHCCCSCDDFSLATNSLSWGWNSTVQKGNAYTIGDCITNVTASTDNNWFAVSVSNNSVNITPSANNTTLAAKTGTITVTYKAHGNDCTSKTFTVSQEPYGCSCDDLTLGAAPSNWAWNATAAKTVGITANSVCITDIEVSSNNSWFTATLGTNSISIAPAGQNTTTSVKSATITVSYKTDGTNCSKTFDVSQASNTCSCDDLTVATTPSAWAWDATAAKTATYTINSLCITGISVSSSNSWFSVTNSVNGSNGTITITPSGRNDTTTTKTSTITISYKSNGSNCSKTFTVEQNPYGCTCGDLSVTSTPSAWTWDATAAKTATYTINATCITDISVTSSNSWFSVTNSVNGSNGTITITPSGQNNTTTAKASTITISYKSNGVSCSKTFDVSQNPYICTCDDLTLGAAPSAWVWNDTATKIVNYTANSTCITDVSVSSSNAWFTVTVNASTKAISVTPSGQNTTTASKVGVITVSYKTNGTNCSKTFNVEHNPYGCSCGDLSISTTSVTWNSWEDTSANNVNYTANSTCITDISISSNNIWFTPTVNTSTKIVTITPSGVNNTTTAKSGVITISYKSNGANCSKTVNVLQPGYVCSCDDLTMVNGNPFSWAWNETGAKTGTYTANSTCITDVSVNSSDAWFTATVNTSTKVITVTPSGQNTTATAKTATITLSYKSNGTSCSKTTEARQEPYVCSCDNLSLTANTIACGGGSNVVIGTYNSNTCVTDLSATSNQSWISNIALSGGNIRATVEANSSTATRSATITVTFKASGSSCTAKTVIVIQDKKCCDCDNLNVTPL